MADQKYDKYGRPYVETSLGIRYVDTGGGLHKTPPDMIGANMAQEDTRTKVGAGNCPQTPSHDPLPSKK